MNSLIGKTIYAKTNIHEYYGSSEYLIYESDYNPCTFSNKCKNLTNTIINSENKEYYTVIGKIISFKYSIRYVYKKIGLFPAILEKNDVRLLFVLDTNKILICDCIRCDDIKSDKILVLSGKVENSDYDEFYSSAKVTNFSIDKDYNNIICTLYADINIVVSKNINSIIKKYIKFDNSYALQAFDNNDIWKMFKKYLDQAKVKSMQITKNYIECIENILTTYKNGLTLIESSIEKCIH